MNLSITPGFQWLKKSLVQPSYEEFYKEARHRFDIRWEQPPGSILAVNNAEDLLLYKNISSGQFGNGALMQQRKNKNYFLMKTLNKQQIISDGNLESLRKEKKLLLSCNFPFIANLIQCIKDRTSVHLLFEFTPNSDDYFRLESRFTKVNLYLASSGSDWHLTGGRDRAVTLRFMSCSKIGQIWEILFCICCEL